jgi:6-phosphogluconolactonase
MSNDTATASKSGDCFVTVCNYRGRSLTLMTLRGSTGTLSTLETLPFPEVSGDTWACPLAVSPNRRFLYVGFRGKPPVVLSFEIDYAGPRLNYLGKTSLVDDMAYLSIDRTGNFLFGSSYHGRVVAVNPIGSDGIVLSPRTVIETGAKTHCILPGPDNRLVLATNMTHDVMLRFRFDAKTGEFIMVEKPAVTMTKGTGPRHFVLHPNERFAYVINEYIGTVDAFSFDPASGDMELLQSSTILPHGVQVEPAATDIHMTPDGKWLYAAERASSTLTGFAVNAASGFLIYVGSEETALSPRGFNIDPTGRYLLALGQGDDKMVSYAIDGSSGKLQMLQAVKVGRSPNWVEILPLPSAVASL